MILGTPYIQTHMARFARWSSPMGNQLAPTSWFTSPVLASDICTLQPGFPISFPHQFCLFGLLL